MAITNVEISSCRVTGGRHSRLEQECEDIVLCENGQNFCFCGIADGKSGARFCTEGAWIALQTTVEYLHSKGIRNMCEYPFSDEFPAELMHLIRRRIQNKAGDAPFEDFASTLLAAAVDCESGWGVLFHLGDGCAIGIRPDGTPILLSKPENGMDPRFTWLTTSRDAVYHVRCSFFRPERLKRMALMTDGAAFLCNGKVIPSRSAALLAEGTMEQIHAALSGAKPGDDASCVLLRFS